MTHEEKLRAWAKGMYTYEAATELLIRGFGGSFAAPGQPWIMKGDDGNPWIEFESIPDLAGAKSGGEQRFLRIAASLASSASPGINLGDDVSGLDEKNVRLVLAAVAHAAGYSRLYMWPQL